MRSGKLKEVTERCDDLGMQVAKLKGVLESKQDDVTVCAPVANVPSALLFDFL